MSDSETWKSVVGYEGLYDVSDRGRVRSLDRFVANGGVLRRQPGRIMRPATSGGYPRVDVCKGGTKTLKYIHRIVLEAFAGPCPDGMEACHNDGNRINNALANLRWDTRKNNQADRVLHGTTCRGERQGSAKLTETQVMAIRGLRGRMSGVEIADRFNVRPSTISAINTGQNWWWLPAPVTT